jgi:glycosyltransferase involved in cell wall biosynthesis
MLFAMRTLEAAALRYASEVILVGPAYLPYMEAMGIAPCHLTVAPTGGRDEKVSLESGARWRASLGLAERVVFLYAGSFNEAYDLRAVVAAAAEVSAVRPEAVWVFVGGGRGASFLREASTKHAFIRLLPSVRREEMGALLVGSDVALIPHADWPLLGITISGKLFDAMSTGVPVLSLRQGAMGAMISASGGGVVAERPTAEALAKAAIRLIDLGTAARAEMGASGKTWILREMPAEAMAERIVDALERLAPGPQRRRALRALAGGFKDALTSRGVRVISAVYGDRVDAVAQQTLRAWISSQPRQDRSASRGQSSSTSLSSCAEIQECRGGTEG